jgi:uncharacterized protein (DUF305 family)
MTCMTSIRISSFRKPLVALALASGAFACLALPASAQMQQGTMQHGAMQHGQAKASAAAPSTAAYKAVAMRMHKDIAIAYSGDADVDFVKGMIPHHQAAIDMAKVELEYGKDEKTRTLAQAIIKAQEAEIADMQAWLKARGQ